MTNKHKLRLVTLATVDVKIKTFRSIATTFTKSNELSVNRSSCLFIAHPWLSIFSSTAIGYSVIDDGATICKKRKKNGAKKAKQITISLVWTQVVVPASRSRPEQIKNAHAVSTRPAGRPPVRNTSAATLRSRINRNWRTLFHIIIVNGRNWNTALWERTTRKSAAAAAPAGLESNLFAYKRAVRVRNCARWTWDPGAESGRDGRRGDMCIVKPPSRPQRIINMILRTFLHGRVRSVSKATRDQVLGKRRIRRRNARFFTSKLCVLPHCAWWTDDWSMCPSSAWRRSAQRYVFSKWCTRWYISSVLSTNLGWEDRTVDLMLFSFAFARNEVLWYFQIKMKTRHLILCHFHFLSQKLQVSALLRFVEPRNEFQQF